MGGCIDHGPCGTQARGENHPQATAHAHRYRPQGEQDQGEIMRKQPKSRFCLGCSLSCNSYTQPMRNHSPRTHRLDELERLRLATAQPLVAALHAVRHRGGHFGLQARPNLWGRIPAIPPAQMTSPLKMKIRSSCLLLQCGAVTCKCLLCVHLSIADQKSWTIA